MIPKVIHYCWFGRKQLPTLALKCIESWRKYMPDYEIREWNEDNFDINITPYTAEAYDKNKYAFVSDYARLWILFNYGGVYLDTDVEILKKPDNLLFSVPFMACEQESSHWKFPYPPVNPGLGIASNKGNKTIFNILHSYDKTHFCLRNGKLDLTTIVTRTSSELSLYGLKKSKDIQNCLDFIIYPWEFFCPHNDETKSTTITSNTIAIHHFAASWMNKYDNLSLFAKIWTFLHLPNTDFRGKLLHLFK